MFTSLNHYDLKPDQIAGRSDYGARHLVTATATLEQDSFPRVKKP